MYSKIIRVPCGLQVIDGAIEVLGVVYGFYSGKSLEVIRKEHPTAEVVDAKQHQVEHEASLRTAPELITREEFIDALEVLPPEGWISRRGYESFKMCEYFSGNITSIYARIGEKHYKFRDCGDMTHEAIIEKINIHLAGYDKG